MQGSCSVALANNFCFSVATSASPVLALTWEMMPLIQAILSFFTYFIQKTMNASFSPLCLPVLWLHVFHRSHIWANPRTSCWCTSSTTTCCGTNTTILPSVSIMNVRISCSHWQHCFALNIRAELSMLCCSSVLISSCQPSHFPSARGFSKVPNNS